MKRFFLLLFAVAICSFMTSAQEEARLLRFPAVHGDQVVFTYAGDLYTVAKSGGLARKLTNHDGFEMFARFSPDGKTIAFTGQYDGNTEVFAIPSEGGVPQRLTYTATLGRDDVSDRMGPNNMVVTWKDDSQIVYRSRKQTFNSFKGQLFLASVEGGLSEELPLPTGGFCSYSPDGDKLAYNQVMREFRTWKYYEGGMADDVWIYDFKAKTTVNITNNKAQDIFPMWYGNKVYFLSDRDRTMNLFCYDLDTEETEKLTNYTKYDIKFPSLGDGVIIYENGGYLYTYDIASQDISKVEVRIANDFVQGRSEFKNASKYINSWAISPDGKRVTFGARGDVWTVPANKGITYNLTETSGVHDRNVEWSPDGKYISYISDATGEDEIYLVEQNGAAEAEKLTKNSDTYKYNPIWSPDSKKLLWGDKKLRLQYIDIESKKVVVIDKATDWEIRSYNWSHDSKWITYSKMMNKGVTQVWVYNTETKEKRAVTDNWFDAGSPVFSENGDYLFFTSSRDFNPTYSWTEWNHIYRDMNKLYFVTLRKDVPNPFEYENDEVEVKEEDEDKKAEGKSKKEEGKDKGDTEEGENDEAAAMTIDFDGIFDRVLLVPGDAGNYWGITPVGNSVYYAKMKSGSSPGFYKYDLEKKKETNLGNYTNFLFSADKKKVLIGQGRKYAVIDAPHGKISIKDWMDLNNMMVWIDLKAEWEQIFTESWRQMRDFFYAPNMHGLDWESIHDKYHPLVEYVNDRNDLNYIIGEMIGEINVGHAYVNGGDKAKPARIQTGLLGAKLSKDKSGYYKIDKILKGQNWNKAVRSPLTEVGVDVSEGDYIVAVNGKSTKNMVDIYMALLNTAGKEVELTVNGEASEKGAKTMLVKPIADESKLYYYNWVHDNIEKVNKATNGQVGYIHIPDMSPAGLNEFVKYFYPQLDKKALIIDDRGNGGGNVSPMIIERLSRKLAIMGMSRNGGVTHKPGAMMTGPLVMLVDRYSASDGDLFPYQFKKLGLGTVIGERTWGGVVGIRGSLPFIDGGDLRKPEFAPFGVDGEGWVIEGEGVEPHIYIKNDPAKEYAGEDEQLNKAIEVILKDLEKTPDLPGIPAYPDKTR